MKRINKNYFVSLNLRIIITFIIRWSLATEFSYKDEASWPLKYPHCGGEYQSPVKTEYEYVNEKDDDLFSMINYDKRPSNVKLSNNGHGIKLEFVWDDNKPPYLSGEILREDKYIFDSMQFHWSRNSSKGSEHILFEKEGVMEMHLVHYNRKYDSVQNALNYDDGLTIIGGILVIYVEERRRRDSDYDYENFIFAVSQKSPAVSQILSNVGSVRTPGSSVDIEPFAISEVRPAKLNTSPFISYFGSLTTPPCTENVLWLLSQYPYQITGEQLQFLQETVEFDHGDNHNNRPVKSMNRRLINLVWGVAGTIN